MTTQNLRLTSAVVAVLVLTTNAFTARPAGHASRMLSELQMGLFDGVKEAFSAPALERSAINSERETPIDRWMGWSVVSEREEQQESNAKAPAADFVDSMDEMNYLAVELQKPMGIVFEENDEEYGGIFVQALKEGGVAAANGVLKEGDQLVAVGTEKVFGLPFDDALGAILNSKGDTTKLVMFRGKAEQFYGPTGASKEWLDEFVSKGGVEVTQSAASA